MFFFADDLLLFSESQTGLLTVIDGLFLRQVAHGCEFKENQDYGVQGNLSNRMQYAKMYRHKNV